MYCPKDIDGDVGRWVIGRVCLKLKVNFRFADVWWIYSRVGRAVFWRLWFQIFISELNFVKDYLGDIWIWQICILYLRKLITNTFPAMKCSIPFLIFVMSAMPLVGDEVYIYQYDDWHIRSNATYETLKNTNYSKFDNPGIKSRYNNITQISLT